MIFFWFQKYSCRVLETQFLGIVTEVCVEGERFFQHLPHGVDRAGRRNRQQIHLHPLRIGLTPQFLQAVEGLEGVHR